MPAPFKSPAECRASVAPEFDVAEACADSRYGPARVYQTWRALYKAYGAARRQFPGVDWISLIAILDVIAVARANRRRVDVSYLAEEMGWPRTTALRRLQHYAGSGYLILTREGRHTYVDNTLEAQRAALRMIDVLIDGLIRPKRKARRHASGPARAAGPHPLRQRLTKVPARAGDLAVVPRSKRLAICPNRTIFTLPHAPLQDVWLAISPQCTG